MKKFAFLDRDGVIVRFPGKGRYVTTASGMKLIPRAAEAVALLTRAGYELVVISNQGCVSHGLVTRKWLGRMTRRMLEKVRRAGGRIRKVYYCFHQSADGCSCKKPKTLLLRKALKGRRLDRRRIFFIGDSAEDIEAGKKFGCRTVLVLSGRNKRKHVRALRVKPDFVKKDLWEAARWMLRERP